VARISVAPNPALTGQTVSFDASGTTPAASILTYQWDLDGNGSFETDTGAVPTTSRSYTSPGTLTTTLKATDNQGATDETTRPLQIDAAPQPQPQPIAQPQLVTQPQPTVQPQPKPKPGGKCSKLKGKKRAACIRKSCGKLKGKKRKACIAKVTRRASTRSRI